MFFFWRSIGGLLGLTSAAIKLADGTMSRRRLSRFESNLRGEEINSSYVAAGGLNWRQARSTGSPPKVKTIGMVVVDFMAARMAGSPPVEISTATFW
jgi:hypothetical protein